MTPVDRRKVLEKVTAHINEQLNSEEAISELRSLGPTGYDWNPRVREAVSVFLPQLVKVAPNIIDECLLPFNSSIEIRDSLCDGIFDKAYIRFAERDAKEALSYKVLLEKCRELGRQASRAVANIESQQISAEVKRFLLSERGVGSIVKETGGSIYPDLILAGSDYSFLPFQKRDKPISGPCRKNPRDPVPSNVPDGCEIKTNQSTKIKVDAHGAHPGLHLGITWGMVDNKVKIHDIWLAYIRIKDYSISDGNVDVTTKKRSFGHDPFISLIRGDK